MLAGRRRVREVPELADLVWEVGPAAVIEDRQPRWGQPDGAAVLVRFGDSVRLEVPEPARGSLVALARSLSRRAAGPVPALLDGFASACESSLPVPPGMVRDALCVLAADRLATAQRCEDGLAPAARAAGEELVVAALWVASAGRIRSPRPQRRRRLWRR
jgi:hypothetical protein